MTDFSEGVPETNSSTANKTSKRIGLGIVIVFLLMTSCCLSLNFLSREPGTLTRVVLRSLYQGLGWGAWAPPLVLILIAGRLAIYAIRGRWPKLYPLRWLGFAIVFVAGLGLAHIAIAALNPIGPVWINPAYNDPASPEYDPARPYKVWEEAVACPAHPQELIDAGWMQTQAYLSSWDIALCGHAGGLVGSTIQLALTRLAGGAFALIVTTAAAAGGLFLMSRTLVYEVRDYQRN